MPRKQQNTILTRKLPLLVKAPWGKPLGTGRREGTCHLLRVSLLTCKDSLKSESQGTKEIGQSIQREEESEAGGSVYLETVLAEDNFLF